MVNRAYTFRQMCEKSDSTLHQYINKINLQNINMPSEESFISPVKDHHLFTNNDVLQQTSFFSDIFCNTNSDSLVDNFSVHNTNITSTGIVN